jgi:hypothetical protein
MFLNKYLALIVIINCAQNSNSSVSRAFPWSKKTSRQVAVTKDIPIKPAGTATRILSHFSEPVDSFYDIFTNNISDTVDLFVGSNAFRMGQFSELNLGAISNRIKENSLKYRNSISTMSEKWVYSPNPAAESYAIYVTSTHSPFSLLENIHKHREVLETKDPMVLQIMNNFLTPQESKIAITSQSIFNTNKELLNYISEISNIEFYYTLISHPIMKESRFKGLDNLIKRNFEKRRAMLSKLLNSQKGNDKIKTKLFFDQTQEIINALGLNPPGASYNH